MTIDPSSWDGILLWAAVAGLMVIAVNLVIGRASRQALRRLTGPRSEARRQRIRFTTQLGQVLVGIVGLVVFTHAIPALRPVGTALLASASVVTIVLGLAAQTTLGNLLAGISIVLFKPFEAGDRIQLAGPAGVETGVVETVNLGNTVVSTLDNRRIVVPNGQLVDQTTVNLTAVSARHLAQITVNVAYGTNLADARRVLRGVVEADPECDEFDSVAVTELGSYFVAVTAFVWCADSLAARRLEFAVYEGILAAFETEGIAVPFPASTVQLLAGGADGGEAVDR